MEIALGSLDDPSRVPPVRQVGAEGVMPFFAELHALPSKRTGESWTDEKRARFASRQHPDHDTDGSPPA